MTIDTPSHCKRTKTLTSVNPLVISTIKISTKTTKNVATSISTTATEMKGEALADCFLIIVNPTTLWIWNNGTLL